MIITLLTDFGTADYFVGAMKGAILSVNPRAQVLDITHDIPAHDIEAGAFTLVAAFDAFPAGTIHVAVVDPGVGSARRAILVAGGGYFFVGPDNGLFGHVYERLREFRVFQLTNESFFRQPVSATFHGRDIFAPVAGALSAGTGPESFGELITDFVRLSHPSPRRLRGGTLEGSIIHIDRFGNCITNIVAQDVSAEAFERGARIVVGNHQVRSFKRFFAEDGGEASELFAIPGSAGFLEIAVLRDSAARLIGAHRGQPVRFYPPR
ncbi:MAG TPA: SAM-dependent chlorinase/fluorinase [Pyrinomonadaceae bacterium]|jgi:S-adenosylmethionine hydrolase|nr:SAM-dependent chlorinase/fluorinase [Pyrinomonadaceae bacterium]